jgi:hypothetical protein
VIRGGGWIATSSRWEVKKSVADRAVAVDSAAVHEPFVLKLVVSVVVRLRDAIDGLTGVSYFESLALFLFDLIRVVSRLHDFLVAIGIHRVGRRQRRVSADHLFYFGRSFRTVERRAIGECDGGQHKRYND